MQPAQEAREPPIIVLLKHWLSVEYVRDPRRALEPENAEAAMRRGAHQIQALLWPYLSADLRQRLRPTLSEDELKRGNVAVRG